MRPHQIFAAMSQEKCEQILDRLHEVSPEAARSTVAAAATALKFRPKFLLKQPPAKRVASVKQALSRVGSMGMAEELLAVYFLKCRLELLTDWLDLMGLEHEDGILTQEEVPCPEAGVLAEQVAGFRAKDDDDDRLLLLRVFAAQPAIEWPALDELVEAEAGA